MKKHEEAIIYVLRKEWREDSKELLSGLFKESKKGTDILQVASYIITLGAAVSEQFDLTTLSSIFDVIMIINLVIMVFLVLMFELFYKIFK